MNAKDLEIPLLAIATALSLELLSGWEGFIITCIIGIYALARLIKLIKSWNYDKEKRAEEKAKNALEMAILQKQLGKDDDSKSVNEG